MNKMEKITFYVGIDPKDEQELRAFVHSLNEDSDEKYFASIEGTFDDPHGYYEFVMYGTWECYKCFIGVPFVKSLNHYED